jgi:hypothetical protein
MSGIFLVAIIIMAIAAVGFVAMPLLKNNRKIALSIAAVAIPVLAVGLYSELGSPSSGSADRATTHTANLSMATPDSESPGKLSSVASLVDGLAARLEENPDDGKNWLLLARSYHHLNRKAEARDAYARAAALGEFDEQLDALRNADERADSSAAQIFGNVRLSDSSRAIVLPTDTVFIFARAVDGPPFPVAVLQRAVSDLPLDFLLNDSQAMNPDAKLSNFEKVVVTARISRSGIATDALQGLEAKSDPILVAENRHINLIIE